MNNYNESDSMAMTATALDISEKNLLSFISYVSPFTGNAYITNS